MRFVIIFIKQRMHVCT